MTVKENDLSRKIEGDSARRVENDKTIYSKITGGLEMRLRIQKFLKVMNTKGFFLARLFATRHD